MGIKIANMESQKITVTGDGSENVIPHNLGVIPSQVIITPIETGVVDFYYVPAESTATGVTVECTSGKDIEVTVIK